MVVTEYKTAIDTRIKLTCKINTRLMEDVLGMTLNCIHIFIQIHCHW